MTGSDNPELIGAALSARAQIRSLAVGAQLMSVLRAADEHGWLALLIEPATVQRVADQVGVSADRVGMVLDVLVAAGVATRAGDAVSLAPGYAALAQGPSGVTVAAVLGDVELQNERVGTAFDVASPGPLNGAQATALAKDWGLQPTPAACAIYAATYGAVPEFEAALRAGGPFLDVGSGVGGALLSTALVFPELRCVGVELSATVADVLRDRVHAAELAGRVEVRAADARTITDDAAYTAAYWAQEFFAEDSRADLLAGIKRALTPGGLLLLQELFAEPTSDGPHTEWLLDRLFYVGMGCSFGRSASALAEEGVAAGYEHVATSQTPAGQLVLLRTPK